MAEIKLDCPLCGQQLECDEDLRGQRISCPSCKGEIIVPVKPTPRPAARVVRAASSESPAEAAPSSDEERELFVLKPTSKAFMGQILLGILLTPVVVGIILLLNVWYKVASLKYRLTTQRLFVQKGLIAKHLEEVELFRVKDVTLKQGILQRILGFGTITVLSTDDSNPQFELIGINNPAEPKEAVRNAFRAARKREGVRSAEFIPS